MLNKLKRSAAIGTLKFIQSVAITGAALLILLKPGISKANDEVKNEIQEVLKKYPAKEISIQENKQVEEEMAKFEMTPDDTINALDFAVQNVDTYYPDMKEHLTTMINSFRDEEHREATITLLNEMIVNITDPEQKTGAIIYALERKVFFKSDFAKKYDSKITDATFNQMDIFRVEYNKRFDVYYANLLANIEQLKAEIEKKEQLIKQKDEQIKQKDEQIKQKDEQIKQKDEQIKQGLKDLENILSKFTPEDIKKNNNIRELTINTKKFYEEGDFPISEHLQSLFDATK